MFIDDVIVPPPVQYRRSVSHGQQQHHQRCGCEPSAACHKSLPDLSDVASVAAETTATEHPATTAELNPIRRCPRRSASSGSVVADDGDHNDDDGDDDIFETYCSGIPSSHG